MRYTVSAKSKLKLALMLVFLLVILGLIIAACFFQINKTLGWFSQNKSVSGTGMKVVMEVAEIGGGEYTLDEGALLDLNSLANDLSGEDQMLPGGSVEFDIGIINSSDRAILVTEFGFQAPDSTDEVGITDSDNVVHYFGDSLYVKLLSKAIVEEDDYTVEEGNKIKFDEAVENWVSYSNTSSFNIGHDGTDYQLNLMTTEDNYFTLNAKAVVIFHVSVTFENLNSDQNIFKGFGLTENSGVSRRKVYMLYDNETN